MLSTTTVPAPANAAQVRGTCYRFTVLTSRLVRMEWSDDGVFVDRPTAVVADRDFPVPDFSVERDGDAVQIRTEHVHLHFDGRAFSTSGLSAAVLGAPDIHYATWRFGHTPPQFLPHRGNLGGTARTLDEVDGACPLEPGILSTYGFAVLDDSASVVLSEDGWVEERPTTGHDLYLFAHGRDYQGALDDYFRLTGGPALVPRHVLGNWWSRYWPYDDDEYLELMDDFAARRVPFSVAVLDMDWHEVDIDPDLGTGWTGYTWNRKLFPDPPAFLAELHRRGLAVALNVHPADGVRRHEDAYARVARAVGRDASTGDAIPFDISSRTFVEAYLAELHHPLEEEGVDFWWLDWQSGGFSRLEGLDPLWMLNHVHFHDSGRDGRRPLTFSRYSGPGSHRYPVGFSGDTIASWASLRFQPYFTATAANIGYFWWSHDIGGHMHGTTDPELTARWVQFGALSPVNRLHSSASHFSSKDPQDLGLEAGPVATRFLRLRHVLVPYLYTAAWRSTTDGVALVRPLYHAHPGEQAAYEHTSSYLLGPDLLVAPITAPRDPESQMAAATAWLPEGEWTDLLTGATYRGGRTHTLHRTLEHYPVLVRAGAVLPLASDATAPVVENPRDLVLRVQPGDGTSELSEDDGTAQADAWRTSIRQTCRRQEGLLSITVGLTTEGAAGPRNLDSLCFDLAGVSSIGAASLVVGDHEHPLQVVDGDDDAAVLLGPSLRLRAERVDLHADVLLKIVGAQPAAQDVQAAVVAILQRARIEVDVKDRAYAALQRLERLELAAELSSNGLPRPVFNAVLEVLSGATR
ncbi:TIM-barrel domain-containing protein [Pseudokineococcus basanitobsidens]|uniref:TIM-barrel domain-containing protein n=1 Tax=Pseudokineococcus basanitobsidens TaxID=1926649 RepID=A0ABU8RIA9_9ACTN